MYMWSYAVWHHSESQGLFSKTSWITNYQSSEMSLDARQSVLVGEKNALPFSLIYIPAQRTSLSESWETSGMYWHL